MKLSLALTALALALPVAAFAGQPPASTEAIHISYQKAELLQPDAVARLEQRVRAAAHRVCTPTERITVNVMRVTEQCYSAAVADALRQLDTAKSYAAAALHTPTSG